MKKLLFLLLFPCAGIFAQSYVMPASNTTYTTCSGNFYDSGGPGANYGSSETRTVTFCPATAGAKMKVVFSSFDIEGTYDFLYIYDGLNTSSLLIGSYTGTALATSTIQASASNSSGALTFRFTSDISINKSGWQASLGCAMPCQTITSVFNNSIPSPDVDGIIKVCKGQSITFNGSGNFSNSGVGATYIWDFDNGTNAYGISGAVTYTNSGVYQVNLNITDVDGCKNSNNLNTLVYVSPDPSFSVIIVADTLICLGDSTTISGLVMPLAITKSSSYSVNNTSFLPDGSGVSYIQCINVNSFNSGQTLATMADFQSVFINMEHSYLGDLQMEIVCPNGQSALLKTYPGGNGTYLGTPIDDVTNGPGIGAQYVFSMTGATLLINGPTISVGTPTGNSIAADTYSPQTSFSNLIGCPLNGNWCLNVTDNLASDDGYVFGWGLDFNAASVPANLSFTPTIVSQLWNVDPSITSVNGDTITVKPASTGTQCYTLSATDGFNCNYITTRCVTVVDTGNCAPIITVLNNTRTKEELVKVYPNPSHGVLVVELQKATNIKMYNALGVLVYDKELPEGKNTVYFSEQSKGVYFIKLNNEFDEQRIKIINQ